MSTHTNHRNASRSSRKHAALAALIALAMAGSALGGVNDGELDGYYVPVRGYAETREVSQPQAGETPRQIGTYRILLTRQGWNELSIWKKQHVRKNLLVTGPLYGRMDMQTFTVSHTLGDDRREGALYTEGDYLLPSTGDMTCSGGIPLSGVETLNFVSGQGAYAGLVAGTLQVQGVLHNCPGQADYLQNDFEVIPDVGGLTFESK